MKIRLNDKVKIIAGKDKGKLSKVLKVYPDNDRVLVEGVNIVKKHIKAGNTTNKEGGIVSIEKPIHISNVMFYDEKSDSPVRIGFKVTGNKKVRISRKTGDLLNE